MKEFFESHIQARKDWLEKKYADEKAFGEFLESIPDWRDRLEGIVISRAYDLSKLSDVEDIGESLIPEVKDLDFNGSRVSFKIRIPGSSWVKEYITIGWFPLELLTNPDSNPVDPEYLKGKLERRMSMLDKRLKERDLIDKEIREISFEVENIKKLLEKKG